MLPAVPYALSQAELLRLGAFLHSPACGRDAMGLSHAHGFLTALASARIIWNPASGCAWSLCNVYGCLLARWRRHLALNLVCKAYQRLDEAEG